jgi:hypothetical protein
VLADSAVTEILKLAGCQLDATGEREEDWNVTWVKGSMPDWGAGMSAAEWHAALLSVYI